MPSFKRTQMLIKPEHDPRAQLQIKSLDNLSEKPTVTTFEFPSFEMVNQKDYATVKKKLGPLATTDPDRRDRSRKDSRFTMNPLIKNPLSVEQEEKRVMVALVQEKFESFKAQIYDQAHVLGYDEGLKKGHAEAFQKFQTQANDRIAALNVLIQSFDNAKELIFAQNETFLIELIFRMVKMITFDELKTDRGYVLRLAKELVSRMGIRDNIRIKISHEDAETIDLLKNAMHDEFGQMQNLQIEISVDVPQGGIRVESQWSTIDAKIETQLAGLYKALQGGTGFMDNVTAHEHDNDVLED